MSGEAKMTKMAQKAQTEAQTEAQAEAQKPQTEAQTEASGDETSVVFDHVTFSYDGKKNVLHDVSLAFPAGQFVALLGGNGSGKSTLVRLINALLIPDEGRVTTFGMDTRNKKKWLAIRQSAGMVFQNPDDQLVANTVRDDVAFGPHNLGWDEERIDASVQQALEAVGAASFADADVQQLSGGQKQRVAIAGVIAMDPRLVVFDESASMLDPQGRTEFVGIIKGLIARGITVLFVTHDLSLAALADRAVVMDEGRVAFDGKPEDLVADTELLKASRLYFNPDDFKVHSDDFKA